MPKLGECRHNAALQGCISASLLIKRSPLILYPLIIATRNQSFWRKQETWKDFIAVETMQAGFFWPCRDMFADMCHSAVLPAVQTAKYRDRNFFFSQASFPTDILRRSVSSSLKLAFLYETKQITIKSLLCWDLYQPQSKAETSDSPLLFLFVST